MLTGRLAISGASGPIERIDDLPHSAAMSIQRSHFILFVRDQRLSATFYRDVLGRAADLDVPGMTEFALGPGVVLGLMPEAGISRVLDGAVEPAAAGRQPRAELYLQVDDPDVYFSRALAAGGDAIEPPAPRDWGDRVGYCRDPDGHLLAFARSLGRA